MSSLAHPFSILLQSIEPTSRSSYPTTSLLHAASPSICPPSSARKPLGSVKFFSSSAHKLWSQEAGDISRPATARGAAAAPQPRALFTGIVEEMGKVVSVGAVEGGGFEMIIRAQVALDGLKLGDSIAVNGTCLTVTSFDSESFAVGLSPETLRKTSLGEVSPGSLVNLERSLQPVSRMGGHFVQGHVDGTGTVVSMVPEGDSLWVKIRTSPEILRYVVPKGFIAVDGTSLTVVEVSDQESAFTFMLVAYTQLKVVIPQKPVGGKVNLEVDILGKYVERMLKVEGKKTWDPSSLEELFANVCKDGSKKDGK